MWVTKYKLMIAFLVLSLYGFQCDEDPVEMLIEFETITASSQYDNAFYLIAFNEFDGIESDYIKLPTGTTKNWKLKATNFTGIVAPPIDCNSNFIELNNSKINISGRPFMDLLEVSFPNIRPFNQVFIDFGKGDCLTTDSLSHNKIFINPSFTSKVFPVKVDTITHVIIQIDGVRKFEKDILFGTDVVKVVIE